MVTDMALLLQPLRAKKMSAAHSNVRLARTCVGHNHSVRSLDKADNDGFMSGSLDVTLKLRNVNAGECIRTFRGHNADVRTIAVIDADRFISGAEDATIKLWNLTTGECIRTYKDSNSVMSAAKINDNEFISCLHHAIKLWDPSTGACV